MSSTGTPFRVLGMLIAAGAIALAACARASQASDQAAAVDAAQLFGQACAKCHGADGSGGLPTVANGPKPIDFRDAAWQRGRSNEEIAGAIRDGRGAMPPFGDVLTSDQILQLAEHVRKIANR